MAAVPKDVEVLVTTMDAEMEFSIDVRVWGGSCPRLCAAAAVVVIYVVAAHAAARRLTLELQKHLNNEYLKIFIAVHRSILACAARDFCDARRSCRIREPALPQFTQAIVNDSTKC